MTITDYFIISNTSMILMMGAVIEYIKKGWEPIGGIAIEMFPSGERIYHQAIIKKI